MWPQVSDSGSKSVCTSSADLCQCRVLQLGAFVIAAVWGVLVFSLSWLGWHSHESGTKVSLCLGCLALPCCDTCMFQCMQVGLGSELLGVLVSCQAHMLVIPNHWLATCCLKGG